MRWSVAAIRAELAWVFPGVRHSVAADCLMMTESRREETQIVTTSSPVNSNLKFNFQNSQVLTSHETDKGNFLFFKLKRC